MTRFTNVDLAQRSNSQSLRGASEQTRVPTTFVYEVLGGEEWVGQ